MADIYAYHYPLHRQSYAFMAFIRTRSQPSALRIMKILHSNDLNLSHIMNMLWFACNQVKFYTCEGVRQHAEEDKIGGSVSSAANTLVKSFLHSWIVAPVLANSGLCVWHRSRLVSGSLDGWEQVLGLAAGLLVS